MIRTSDPRPREDRGSNYLGAVSVSVVFTRAEQSQCPFVVPLSSSLGTSEYTRAPGRSTC